MICIVMPKIGTAIPVAEKRGSVHTGDVDGEEEDQL